jgi:phosphohistidine phosphatase SixA
MTLRRRQILALLPAPFLAACAGTRTLAADLKDGGYVIYLRHAESEGKPEPAMGDMKDCLWQANLTPAGKAQAARVGEVLRERGVRYGQIASSPFCRCRDTAQLVTHRPPVIMPELLYHPGQSPNAQAATVERLRILVSNRDPGGRCTLLVGHGEPFRAMTGIELGAAQGAIIRPELTKDFEVVGFVDPTGVRNRSSG